MSTFLNTKADKEARLPIPPKVWFPLSTRNTISKKLLGGGVDAESRDLYTLIEGAINEGYLTIPGGGQTFLSLLDTENSYATHAGEFVRVNASSTGLEFAVTGDMNSSVYDPLGVAANVFDMDNMVEGGTNKILNEFERAIIASVPIHLSNFNNPHLVTKAQVGLANVPNVDTTNASNITTGTLPTSVLPPLAIGETFVVASEIEQLALTAQAGDIAIRTDISTSFVHNGGTAGTMADWTELLSPGGSVTSVNGYTGVVVLTTSDIAEGTNLYYTEARVAANPVVDNNTTHRSTTTGNPHMVTASDVGLGNVDNTSDLDKPISTATQTALDSKLDSVIGGTNISVDITDPNNPIINATGLITDHGSLTGLGDDDHTQYHTDARADTWLSTKTTTNLTEGTNLYYTEARVSGNADVVANTAKISYPPADAAKLAGIETGATADQSDAEIETAYNNQVDVVSQVDAEAGTSSDVYRWTPERVKQAIDANIPLGDLKVAAYRSAALQDVTSTSDITIEWDNTRLEDTDVYDHDNVTNNSQIEVLEDGKYLITGAIVYTGSTSNYRLTQQVTIRINGTTTLDEFWDGGYIRASTGANENSVQFSTILDLTANDYFEVLTKRISTTAGDGTTVAGTNISVVQLKGIKGDKGDDGAGTLDPNAIHDNVAGEINAISLKSNAAGADEIIIEDSADSFSKKKTTLSSLPISSVTQTALDGKLDSVVGGTDISIDNTDPNNPIINSTATGVSDHGALTGLTDDDHTQYHTEGRANTWLGTKSTTDLAEGANLYYTEARVSANTDVAANTTARHDAVTLAGTGTYLSLLGQQITVDPITESDISDLGNYSVVGHTHTASDITDFDTEVSNNASVVANTAKVSFPGFTSLLADYGFTDNSSNWNTAFGWGDHSTQGYLTSAGDVSKVGTPANNQLGVWTGDGTIEGDANLTWNGSLLRVLGQIGTSVRTGTATSIVGADSTNNIVDVTIGSGLSLSSGTLSATGGTDTNIYDNDGTISVTTRSVTINDGSELIFRDQQSSGNHIGVKADYDTNGNLGFYFDNVDTTGAHIQVSDALELYHPSLMQLTVDGDGSNINLQAGDSDAVSLNLSDGKNGSKFTDGRLSTNQSGLEYAADYSANYVTRSLVDKGYVDSAVAGAPTVLAAVKTSNEVITNDASLSLDGELQYDLEANSYYTLEAVIIYRSGTTPDFYCGFQGPSGSTMYWQSITDDEQAANIISSLETYPGAGSSIDRIVKMHGTIKTSATAGTFGFRWSQRTSNAQSTTLMERSYIKSTKLD